MIQLMFNHPVFTIILILVVGSVTQDLIRECRRPKEKEEDEP